MKAFLVACATVVVLGFVSWGVLSGLLSQSAAEAYSAPGAVRIHEEAWPDPRGLLSHPHDPVGGIESGRSPAGGTPPDR